ncbi:putative transcription factor bHLH family [Dioscorea sansibarensis]
MAQFEGSETSVASSSPTPNWWEIHATPLSSWHSINRWQLHSHQSTSSSCDEDNSTSADLSGGPSDNNLWTHVLLNVGGGGDMSQHHNHDDGDNFLEVLSSKSLPTEIFEPACDYLKKMDSSWEINNPPSFNNFNGSLMEHERLTNLSDLVKNWSIAPPAANSHFDSLPCNVTLNPFVHSHIKTELLPSINEGNSSNYLPYMHDIKMENQHHQNIIGSSAPPSSVMSQFLNGSTGMGYHVSVNDHNNNNHNNNNNNLENTFNNAMRSSSDVSWSGSSRSLSDFRSFKPVQFRTCKQVAVKGSDHSSSQDTKKQGYDTPSTKGSGRSTGTTNDGKKKRSEDNSEALLKKSKHDNSSASSSAKVQVPKVKFADRISALQQIVSPFGKTDTASVLMEAINYIRFLQEQVQLLSDPYMKLNASKEHNSWGGMEGKEKDKVDLRTRGLCLVPISCTPQAYRENTGPDYWTPTYRGCLFR